MLCVTNWCFSFVDVGAGTPTVSYDYGYNRAVASVAQPSYDTTKTYYQQAAVVAAAAANHSVATYAAPAQTYNATVAAAAAAKVRVFSLYFVH